MKKALLVLFSVLLIFIAYEVVPIYAIIIPKTVVSTTVTAREILGEKARVTVHRCDTFQFYHHFVSFNATCEIDGIPIMNVTTDKYPLYKIERSIETCSIPEEWKERWDNILFVLSPGPPETYIKYNHPDNYDTYHQGEINVDYELQGDERIHCHIAQHRIEEDKAGVELGQIIAGLMGVLMGLLLIPEGVLSKVAAGVIALIIGILEVLGEGIKWFLNNVVQTELGDGWSWMWGFGSWWIFKWWTQSFGAWRDWGWFFVVLNTYDVTDYIPKVGGIPNTRVRICAW